MLKTFRVRSTLVALVCSVTFTAHAMADAARHINVPAGELVVALETLSRQAAVDLVFQPEQLKSFRTEGVSGTYSPEDAIRILLRGTPLQLRTDASSGAMVIAPAAGDERAVDPAQSQRRSELQEIIVTGTHIRGVAPESSPLITFDRADIDRSGVTTVAEFLRKVPQNFSQLDGETFLNNNVGSLGNNSRGSTVNLRGLGAGSTLVLLNGRRISAAGGDGSFIDVSMIPLSAIERIEVLTDGGAALYGSDGVAGVVNFVLRRDFEGAETGARYGEATDGGATDLTLSQMVGHDWDTGNALAIFEHSDQGTLAISQRSYIPPQTTEIDIIPSQRRNSAVLSGRQQLSEATAAFADMLFSERDFSQSSAGFGLIITEEGRAQAEAGSLGVVHDFSREWQGEVVADHSRTRELRQGSYTDGVIFIPIRMATDSRLTSIEMKADGPLLEVPAGKVRASIGLSQRREEFRDVQNTANSERDVFGAFGELHLPIIGEANRRTGAQRLEISAAARFDEYEDVGSAFNPRAGLLWSPLVGLNLRGTYATSYRVAPLANMAATHQYLAFEIPDPAAADQASIVLLPTTLSNSELDPEEATSFTAGFDWRPAGVPDFSLSMSYFKIKFTDRIFSLTDGLDAFSLLERTDLLGPFITRDPDPAEISRIFADETVDDPFGAGIGPADIEVFIDARLQNVARMETSGLDFQVQYSTGPSSLGELQLSLSAAYIFDLSFQSAAGAPVIERVDTVFQPVDLRAQGGVSWTRGTMSSAMVLNYTDGYTNNVVTPAEPIDSWVTADWQIRYEDDAATNMWRRGLSLALVVQNVTNERPPFVSGTTSVGDLGFDSTNASPRGRFIALQFRKRWL